MKRNLIKRTLVFLLAVAMIVPTLAATAVPVLADEYIDEGFDFDPYGENWEEPYEEPQEQPQEQPQEEPQQETPIVTPPQEETPIVTPPQEDIPEEPIIKPVVSIKATPTEASFGTVSVGQSATTKVTVTVGGTVGVNLTWIEVDNDDFFAIAAPQQTLFMPGETAEFILSLKAREPGSYGGSISFVGIDAAGNQDTASTRVSVTIQGSTPKVNSVTVTPGSVSIKKGGSAQFSATVKGTDISTTDVTWSVKNNTSSNTSINDNGYLTVGSDESASAVTVVATSVADTSKAGNASVSITAEKSTHYVSVTAREGGTASGGGTVTDGSSCTVYASPSGGYAFKGWYDQTGAYLSNIKNYTIENVKSDLTLIAQFTRCSAMVYTNSDPDNGGGTSGGGTYNIGSKVTVKANPYEGYKFVGWRYNGNIVCKDREYTIVNVSGEYRLTAVFEKNKYNVRVEVSPANTGAVDGACGYEPGRDAILKAYPTAGYVFKGWYENNKLVSSDANYVITKINCDHCLYAVFEKPGTKACLMTSTAGEGGTITPAVSAPVPAGTTVNYVITPANGYYISGLRIDGTAVAAAPTYTFTNVQGDHKIEAFFAKKDAAKASKPASSGKVATGKTLDEAVQASKDVMADASKKEEAQKEIAEIKLNTDMDTLTGVLQEFNMTTEEAYLHFYDAIGEELFTQAYNEGMINVVVNNDFDAEGKASRLNYENYEAATPSISNLQEVYDNVVTDMEALGTLEGKRMEIHWDITNTTGVTPQDELDALSRTAKENGLGIDNTFDITILKTFDGATSIVSDTGVVSQITLKVPESLKNKGGRYKVLHIHDGNVDVLENLSNDPNFIKFETSTYSTFAMAYETTMFGEAGTVTGNEAKIYVDTINDVSHTTKAANTISPIVIVLIIVIVVCIALVIAVITLSSKNRKKPGGKPPVRPREA